MLGALMHGLGILHFAIFSRVSDDSWLRLPHPPPGPIVVRGPGPDPGRVLLVGRASAVSWGVTSHDLGFAGKLARATSQLTGRGTDIDILAGPAMTLRGVQRALTASVIGRYDAIVLSVGVREAVQLMPVATWRRWLSSLLDQIADAPGSSASVVVIGAEERMPVRLTPGFDRLATERAHAFNVVSRELVADRPRTTFRDSAMMPAEAGGSLLEVDKSKLYDAVAWAIAPSLAAVLTAAPARLNHPIDEEARSGALALLRTRDFSTNPRVLQVLTAVRGALDLRSADLFLVDHDSVRMLATTGGAVASRPAADTMSREAIEYRAGVVIPDLAEHERLSTHPAVVGPPYLRFYAAHPVETPDGHRVAILSVVDTAPREFSARESSLLREFAAKIGVALFEN
jgi:hypothetical protein